MIHKKTVLANGTRIITEGLSHAKSVSLGIWVNAGSRDELDKERGIFHLIEHMIFKGTQSRSALQIAKDLDTMGGFSNAFTGKEQTCFHARVLDKHLHSLTDLLSDIFINSIFAESDLELEKGVVLQEISMTEDTPDEYVNVLFDQTFWGGDPLGRPILGTKETVSNITRREILDYVSDFYGPKRLLIAAAGNVDHDLLVEYFRPLFEPLQEQNTRPPARPIPLTTPTVSSYPKELEQVHLCLGAQASSLSGERRFAESIFNTILGGNMSSRLFQEIREKRGLAYSLYSHMSAYMDTGLIRIYVATDQEEINRVLELIGLEIKGIQGGDLSANDIAGAKEYLIGGILLAAENMGTLMMRLARNEFIFERYISYEELIAEIEKVSLDEVIEVAQEIFSAATVSLTVLGPVDRDKISVDPLNF
ncbi:MAG: insulinase family protein [Deltaproteobacteria bacterium]|nr:MAG: insulinase family protein [Deltaproteobacteria bacterium]